MENTSIKILHQWEITLNKQVDETISEDRDGQTVQVTRKVTKPVVTKMALKQPTRRELRAAELFYGKQFNRFVSMGFLPRSILINKHLDLTGGVLSEKERSQASKLAEKHSELEADLVRSLNEPEEVKKKIRDQLVAVRTEMVNINAANEAVFSQTAEVKAQNQLSSWFALNLIMIDRAGKWQTYFDGDDFDKKEEFMWNLEETQDEFYLKSIEKITTYIQLYNMGASTPEQFQKIEEELAKQAKASEDAKRVKELPEPVVATT